MSLWDNSTKDCTRNTMFRALHDPHTSVKYSLTEHTYKNINPILGSRAYEFWLIVRYRLESSKMTSALEKTHWFYFQLIMFTMLMKGTQFQSWESLTKCKPSILHYKCYDVDVFVSEDSCVGDLVPSVVMLKSSRSCQHVSPRGMPLGNGGAAFGDPKSLSFPLCSCQCVTWPKVLSTAKLMPKPCLWTCTTVNKTELSLQPLQDLHVFVIVTEDELRLRN